MPAATIAPPPGAKRTEDRRLIERLQSGDQSALAALYDEMSKRAFGLAYRVTGNAASAEDAVQDAFITLWRQAPRLSADRGCVTSLLMTIVHRRAIDAVRRDRRAQIQALRQDQRSALEVEEAVSSGIEREFAHALVGVLPHDQRRTILLAYFEGRTCEEIARIMSVPAGTVKSRLRLALQKMRTASASA